MRCRGSTSHTVTFGEGLGKLAPGEKPADFGIGVGEAL